MTSRNASTSRRGFLKAGGGLLIGFSLAGFRCYPAVWRAAETAANPAPGRLDAWLRIGKDGRIQRVYRQGGHRHGRGHGAGPDRGGRTGRRLPSAFTWLWAIRRRRPTRAALAAARRSQRARSRCAMPPPPLGSCCCNSRSAKLGVPADQLQVKRRHREREGRRVEERFLRCAGRRHRSERCAEGLGRRLCAERGRPGQAQGSGELLGGGPVDAPRRPAAEDPGARRILHRRSCSWDAARARDPAGRRGRGLGECRRDSAAKQIPGYVKTVVKGNFVGVVAESEWVRRPCREGTQSELERARGFVS